MKTGFLTLGLICGPRSIGMDHVIRELNLCYKGAIFTPGFTSSVPTWSYSIVEIDHDNNY